MIGCENSKSNEDDQGEVQTESVSTKSRELSFSLKNETDVFLREIKVGLPDTILMYEKLHPNSTTNKILVKCAYSYGYIEFKDNLDSTYMFFPIDYSSEKLYTLGKMTHTIKSIDPIEKEVKFDFNFE